MRVISLRTQSSFAVSQIAQVLGHVAELPDQLGVAEVAGGGIPGTAEGDRTDMAGLARQRLGAHDGGVGAEALSGLAGRDAIVGRDERQTTNISSLTRLIHETAPARLASVVKSADPA
jgi:hypothetical protein